MTNGFTQNCGTIYGAGYVGGGSAPGVRQFSTATNTWNSSSLVNTAIFTAPNTINNGGPIAIDPLSQDINMVTDAADSYNIALFKFSSITPTIIGYPSNLNFIYQPTLCSGYRSASHLCYYMTSNFLTSAIADPGAAFFSIDLTNPASPVAKVYASSLSPGSPFISNNKGADICFDLNGTGYFITSSKQLYRFVTDETAMTAAFTYIASLSSLSFTPTGVTFDPANNKLVIVGNTQKVSEYDLSNNTVTALTNTSNYVAPDLTGCFFPDINPVPKPSLKLFDVTQGTATPTNIGVEDVLTFTITIYNTGTVNAGNFTVMDSLPAGISYVANSTKMNGATVADAPSAENFPFNNGRESHSGNQAANSGILTTSMTAGFDSTVITYNVVVTGSLGQKIITSALASIAGSSPAVPTTKTTSLTFKIGGGIALPVTLVNFKGTITKGTAKLNWETASEFNNNRFIIERSLDGKNFDQIGSVPSYNPNSASLLQYTFIDNHLPFAPELYYRLRQVDIDGKYEFSPVLILKTPTENVRSLIVMPNPFQGRLNVNVAVADNIDATLVLSNISGMVLIRRKVSLARGNNAFDLNEAAQLSKGMYLLQFISASEIQAVKLIKD
jgi:uncharacterized repeat protein (TIGR01451 family)